MGKMGKPVSAAAGVTERGLWKGVLLICLTGLALGGVYNAFGLGGDPPCGLEWFAQDKLAALPTLESFAEEAGGAGEADESYASYTTDLSDPLAIPDVAVRPGLPEIPPVGRPVRVELGVVRQYFDAAAAVIVDARDPGEYAEGHIPGALNLPYDMVISDTTLVDAVETGGRPVIAYCGGEGCEVSLAVAEEFCGVGHERVAVYVGGFPEWVELGNPVERGAGPGGGGAWTP